MGFGSLHLEHILVSMLLNSIRFRSEVIMEFKVGDLVETERGFMPDFGTGTILEIYPKTQTHGAFAVIQWDDKQHQNCVMMLHWLWLKN